jgi:hypothetical protein
MGIKIDPDCLVLPSTLELALSHISKYIDADIKLEVELGEYQCFVSRVRITDKNNGSFLMLLFSVENDLQTSFEKLKDILNAYVAGILFCYGQQNLVKLYDAEKG